MATVNLILNTRYQSPEEKYPKFPIVFIIRNNGTNSHIGTGIRIEEKYFDKTKWIKKGTPDILDHLYENVQLQKKLADIQSFISELTNSGEVYDMTAAQIKRRYIARRAKEKYNFSTYFKYFAGTKKGNTARIYLHTWNLLKDYAGDQIHFADINPKFLRDFEIRMTDKGMKINTISIHMRNIRAVFNSAVNDEVIELNLYPFRKYKIKKEKTLKRNLTIEEIKRFKDYDLTAVSGLSRDVFMLSFYLIGINLMDLCYLTKKDIRSGRLEYKRRKTGKEYSIKLEPEAKRLIKKLSGKTYLINLLERYADYDAVRKYINKGLKKAAKKAGIDKPVSTYYCRHSWATIASKLDIPKETISAALGHEIGSETTSIYIEYDMEKVDKANRRVIQEIRL
jgi:integrase